MSSEVCSVLGCGESFKPSEISLSTQVSVHTRKKHPGIVLSTDVVARLALKRCECCEAYWGSQGFTRHVNAAKKKNNRREDSSASQAGPPDVTAPDEDEKLDDSEPDSHFSLLDAEPSSREEPFSFPSGRRVRRIRNRNRENRPLPSFSASAPPPASDPLSDSQSSSVSFHVTVPPVNPDSASGLSLGESPNRYALLASQSEADVAPTCAVCKQPSGPLRVLPCGHSIHNACSSGSVLTAVLSGNHECPLCPLVSQLSSQASAPETITRSPPPAATPSPSRRRTPHSAAVTERAPRHGHALASPRSAPSRDANAYKCPVRHCSTSCSTLDNLKTHLNSSRHSKQDRADLSHAVLLQYRLEICRDHCPTMRVLKQGGLQYHLDECRRISTGSTSLAPSQPSREPVTFAQACDDLRAVPTPALRNMVSQTGSAGSASHPASPPLVSPRPSGPPSRSAAATGGPDSSSTVVRPRSGKSPVPDDQLSDHVPSPQRSSESSTPPPTPPQRRLVFESMEANAAAREAAAASQGSESSQQAGPATPVSRPAQSPQLSAGPTMLAPSMSLETIDFLSKHFASRPSIKRKVPQEVLPELIKTVRPILSALHRAESDSKHQVVEQKLLQFLLVPSAALTQTRGGKRHRSTLVATMKHKLALINASREAVDQPPRFSATVNGKGKKDHMDKCVEEALELIADGHLGAAANRLTRSAPTEITPEVITELQSLHLPSNEPVPPLPDEAPGIAVTGEEVRAIIKEKCRNGSSAGLSGWSGDLIYALCKDPECLSGMTAIIRSIVNNRLGGLARDLVLASCLTALLKDPAKEVKANIRPIAVSEVLYRAAMMVAIKRLEAADVVSHFEPLQLGTLSFSGVERAFHKAQARLERAEERMEQDFLCVSVDISNAFGSIDRTAVANAIYTNPVFKNIRKPFAFAYRSPSVLCLYASRRLSAFFESAQGVRQGDPLSSILFSAAIHAAYQAAQDVSADLVLAAIQDDLTISGPAADVLRAYAVFKEAAARLGLSVSVKKTWAYAVNPSENTKQQLRALSIELFMSPTVKRLLGGPYGLCQRARADWVLESMKQYQPLFDALGDARLPPQHAALLIRNCLLPVACFQARICPPEVTARALELHDRQVLELALRRLDIAELILPPETVSRLRLPLSKGGYGLPSLEGRRFHSFLSSISAALPELSAFLHSDATTTTVLQAKAAHQHLISSAPATQSLLKATFREYWEMMAPLDPAQSPPPSTTGLQKKLSVESDKLAFKQLIPRLSPPHQASLLSASTAGASRWLSAFPSRDTLTMTPEQFKGAVWAYFLLPITPLVSSRCPANSALCAATLDSSNTVVHAMSCPGHSSHAFTGRHDLVKDVIIDAADSSGAETKCEFPIPSRAPGVPGNIADIILRVPDKQQLRVIDVVVTCPFSGSALSGGSATKSLVAATRAEKDKKSAYQPLLRDRPAVNAAFTPFAVECSGALGASAAALLADIAEAYAVKHRCKKEVAFARFATEINVAIHIGNSRVLSSFLNSVVPVQ